ncbi:MAG TPA: hypothetical protein VFH66_16240 [Mycobacteriales bacterium]|nr:hypothetical protein [Mycobacteriales bacterium]
MADGDRTFLERTLSELRRERTEAVAAWRAAGGVWAVDGTPTHPALFRLVQDVERRSFDLSLACLPSHPDRLLHRLRLGERDAIDQALSWLEEDPFARRTG